MELAEPLLLESVAILEHGANPDVLRVTLRTLADVCDATGRADEAAGWRARRAALDGAAKVP